MTNKKWIFVTAGSRGIGAEIVRRLAEEGYSVIFTWHTNQEKAEKLVQSLDKKGLSCRCYCCDVRDHAAVKDLCERLLQAFGAPFGIVNNAGISKDKLLINTEVSEWQEVMDININSVFYTIRSLLPAMIQAGQGAIINIGSVAGLRGNAGQSVYSATKAAQAGLTRSLAREVGLFQIRVNCIAPGPIETDMLTALPDKKRKALTGQTALKKFGQPADVANMVSFLFGPGGEHITGQTLVIDGGLSV